MKLTMLFVQTKNVKTMACRIMVISRFAANMVRTLPKDIDDGKTVCERWILIKENKVEVHTSAGIIGVNSW